MIPFDVFNFMKEKLLGPIILIIISSFFSACLWIYTAITALEVEAKNDIQEDEVVLDLLSTIQNDLNVIKGATVTNGANISYLLKEQGLTPIIIQPLHIQIQ